MFNLSTHLQSINLIMYVNFMLNLVQTEFITVLFPFFPINILAHSVVVIHHKNDKNVILILNFNKACFMLFSSSKLHYFHILH